MDEDTDPVNWVLVDTIDCAEEALDFYSSVRDSDQESDGSISIINDHPTDSYSEEEHEQPTTIGDVENATPVITITTHDQTFAKKDDSNIQVLKVKPSENGVEDVLECVYPTLTYQVNDGDVSSTSDSSSSTHWACVDERSKLEISTSQKPLYECSHRSVQEISPNMTEADTESTTSNQECQAVIKNQVILVPNMSNRDSVSDGTFNRIGIGILISMMVLVGSHLIQQYSDYQDDKIQTPSESFLDGLADNEKARAVIEFCMDRQKSKGEYSEHAVEKCVLKRLRKKNREEAMKKTEIYLQMKERILELRERELAEKEKEILRKWRKRTFSIDDLNAAENTVNYNEERKGLVEEESATHFKELDTKYKKRSGFKKKKRRGGPEIVSDKEDKKNKIGKSSSFREKSSWNFEEAKATDRKHNKHTSKDIYTNKKTFKQPGKEEKTMKMFKMIKCQKKTSKQNLKDFKGDKKEDPNKEWYMKYNPVKNTVELINITTLPKQDSLLIKKGNKTINGQWYFSLYGASRTNIRNKERVSEWYFKRGHFRENKRDKAKWYFDYMSARDNTRYFY